MVEPRESAATRIALGLSGVRVDDKVSGVDTSQDSLGRLGRWLGSALGSVVTRIACFIWACTS